MLAVFWGTLAFAAGSGIYVTTQKNDSSRSGLNPAETLLTVGNVSQPGGFGKIFTLNLSQPGPGVEQIYAQPLYAGGVTVGGVTHNVLYLASQLNNVYAFDADQPGSPLWQVNLGTPVPSSEDIVGRVGITSTPVIDVAKNAIYVVAETALGASNSQFKLHALDLSTGAEKFGGPAVIAGSVAGTGSGTQPDSVLNGRLSFNAWQHRQRPALLLLNGTIYIAFASHGDQTTPLMYHGWIFGYDEKTLRLTAIQCTTPNGGQAGVWQGGEGLSSDGLGNVYVTTGNGDLDPNNHNYGQSVLKLSALHGLALEDYFAPDDWSTTNPADYDLGATGALVIPGTSPRCLWPEARVAISMS